MLFHETPEDLAIVAWYDSLTEETLAALPGYEDGLTPRQAWQAYNAADCLPPATDATGESLAAPAPDGQGVGTSWPCSRLTVLAFVSPCGNWRRVDDRSAYGMSPLWGVINSRQERSK